MLTFTSDGTSIALAILEKDPTTHNKDVFWEWYAKTEGILEVSRFMSISCPFLEGHDVDSSSARIRGLTALCVADPDDRPGDW